MPISGSKVRLDHTKPKDKKKAKLIERRPPSITWFRRCKTRRRDVAALRIHALNAKRVEIHARTFHLFCPTLSFPSSDSSLSPPILSRKQYPPVRTSKERLPTTHLR